MSLSRKFMENKNNQKELLLILNFVRWKLVFYFVLMSLREVLISLKLIGLFNTIHQMILMTTSIELEEQLVEHKVLEELFYSFTSMNLDFCAI